MTNLVVLSEEREKQVIEDQQSLIAGIKKLLQAAENGEVKGLCYATGNRGDIAFLRRPAQFRVDRA